jgi:hypothetical protein
MDRHGAPLVSKSTFSGVFRRSQSISKISIWRIEKTDMSPLGAKIFGGNDSSGNIGRSVNFLDFHSIGDRQVS